MGRTKPKPRQLDEIEPLRERLAKILPEPQVARYVEFARRWVTEIYFPFDPSKTNDLARATQQASDKSLELLFHFPPVAFEIVETIGGPYVLRELARQEQDDPLYQLRGEATKVLRGVETLTFFASRHDPKAFDVRDVGGAHQLQQDMYNRQFDRSGRLRYVCDPNLGGDENVVRGVNEWLFDLVPRVIEAACRVRTGNQTATGTGTTNESDVKNSANSANNSKLFLGGNPSSVAVEKFVVRVDAEKSKPEHERSSHACIARQIAKELWNDESKGQSLAAEARRQRRNGKISF